ncbi:MAG TPA: hypothetical protein VHE61_12915 [Opitutaceae bacterium]|nr:hypothetical protein [Opitutaceae bacterium]
MKTNADHGRTRSPRRPTADERGSALFLLLIMAVVMATIMAGIYSYIGSTAQLEKRSNIRLESTYAAEYAFEQAYGQLNTLISSNTQNAPDAAHTSAVTNLSTAPTSVFGSADGYTWLANITVPVENGYPTDSFTSFNSQTGLYKYMTVVEFTRKVGNMTEPVHMQFQREWDYSLTPLFQYAIFYNNDLELFPGAQFIVGGKVHSNGTIYTGTSASIEFTDNVTYVNGIVTGHYSPNDPRSDPGNLKNPTYDTKKYATTAENPPGVSSANTSDGNANNDGPRELIEVPDVHSTDPNSNDRMYDKAGLKVLVNSSSTDSTAASGVAVAAGTKVFLTEDGTQIPSTDPLATYLSGLMSSGTMNDYREGKTLTTTDLDVSAVNTAYTQGGLPETIPSSSSWPNNSSVPSSLRGQSIPSTLRGKDLWNGILYISDISNTSTHRTGVRLLNGTDLPDGSNSSSPKAGLTVATDNAAYIVGDYNTGGTPPVDTSSSTSADPQVSGYTRQPAAVMADAITIVSSNWISGDYNSKSSLSQRPAVNTTVNSALISGVVESVKTGANAAYSGGVENYFRLLENWTPSSGQKRLTYYGSIVNLYDSQQSTAKWITTGTYYNAPVRNWYFDTNYLNPNSLPPGTPIVRSLLRGQWVQVE